MSQTPVIQNIFRLQDFFVSSLSFNIKAGFTEDAAEGLKITIDRSIAFSTSDKKLFSVEFDIKIDDKNENFNLSLSCSSVFQTEDDITEEFKQSDFITANAPAIAFPFARSFINTLTVNAGMPSVIIPAYNFSL